MKPSHILDNLELYLTFVGVGIIFLVPLVLDLGSDVLELALAALAVGVIHGLLFWTVRRRQRHQRRRLILGIRGMLRESIGDNLDQVLTHARPPGRDLTEDDRRRLAEIAQAVRHVTRAVEALSVESLHVWESSRPVEVADA